PVGAHRLEQQLEGVLIVSGGIEVQAPELVIEVLTSLAQAPGPETAHVIRNRAAAVRDDQFEIGEVVKHPRREQGRDGDAFLVDEFERENTTAIAARPGRATPRQGGGTPGRAGLTAPARRRTPRQRRCRRAFGTKVGTLARPWASTPWPPLPGSSS